MGYKVLSVITICYNEKNLRKTCESIVNQSFQNFEWIVVDGGSEEKYQKIFEEYKYRIDKFISEPDKGVYNAYNKGINLATCKWVHFLNAGDTYYNSEVLTKVFDDIDYNADVVYGDMHAVKNIFFNKNKIYKIADIISDDYFINNGIPTPSTFIKKDLFDKCGLFNEKYKIVSDLERWIAFQKNNAKFKHIPIIVSTFDTTGLSSNKKHKLLHRQERMQVFEENYSKDFYDKAIKQYKPSLTLLQRIFSVLNSPDNTHKIVRVLNIPFYFERKHIPHNKKITIITICYNDNGFEKTCKSIVNQKFQDFEWIVIDGGSEEKYQRIFNKYKYRIDKFISEPDSGIYNAYNKGIKLATCKYLHFLNAGDTYTNKNVLKKIFAKNNYDADILYGDTNYIYTNNIFNKIHIRNLKEVTKKFFLNSNIQTSSTFFKRELFDKYGLFNEEYKIVSDYEKLVQFNIANATFKYIPVIISNFYRDGISNNAKFKNICDRELKDVKEKYYSEEDLKSVKEIANRNLSFKERIFSLTNDCDHKYKNVTILNKTFKIRRSI